MHDKNGKIYISGGSDCLSGFLRCGHVLGSRAICTCVFCLSRVSEVFEILLSASKGLYRLEKFFLQREAHFNDCFRLVYFLVHCTLIFAGTSIAWLMQ